MEKRFKDFKLDEVFELYCTKDNNNIEDSILKTLKDNLILYLAAGINKFHLEPIKFKLNVKYPNKYKYVINDQRRLDFYHDSLDKTGFNVIVKLLEFNTSITDITFRSMDLTDDDFLFILTAIKSNRGNEFKLVDIGHNLVTNKSCQVLAELFNLGTKQFPLRGISLKENNEINAEGLKIFADTLANCNTSLRTLNLCGLNLADDFADSLTKIITKCQNLDSLGLCHNKFTSQLIKSTKNNFISSSSLTQIDLTANTLTGSVGDFCDIIKKNNTLQTVILRCCGYTSIDAKKLISSLKAKSGCTLFFDLRGTNNLGEDCLTELAGIKGANK